MEKDLRALYAVHGRLLRIQQDCAADETLKRAYRYVSRHHRTPAETRDYLERKGYCSDCAALFVDDVLALQRAGIDAELDPLTLVPAASVFVIHDGESRLIKFYKPRAIDPAGARRTSRAVIWHSQLNGGLLNLPFGRHWMDAAEQLIKALHQKYGDMPGGGEIQVSFTFVPSEIQTETGESAWGG